MYPINALQTQRTWDDTWGWVHDANPEDLEPHGWERQTPPIDEEESYTTWEHAEPDSLGERTVFIIWSAGCVLTVLHALGLLSGLSCFHGLGLLTH